MMLSPRQLSGDWCGICVIVTMRSVGYPISESSRGAIEKAIRRAAAEEKVARLRAFDAARVAADEAIEAAS